MRLERVRAEHINRFWRHELIGGRLALRAVVFDYGIVLTGPPDAEAWTAMVRITGLNAERFAELFWAGRPAYDEGKVTGMGFWRWFQREAGMAADEAQAAELNRWDARLWTVENRVMVAWQEALKARGLQTAILSNMGDNVLESVERAFQWIQRFDLRVWSYQEGVAKPDAAIYRLALERLGARAEETLFIDDKRANVEAARALGIMAIEYESVEGLRRELMARGMDRELPLPG